MSLSIQSNSLFNRIYAPFKKTFNTMQRSAERMATGLKYPDASYGSGSIGIANQLRNKIGGVSTTITSTENAKGYVETQDSIFKETRALIDRMAELAFSATDPLKTTSDRTTLNDEFRSLEDEIRAFDALKYNGFSLFDDTDITLRIGIESTDTHTLQSVNFSSLTFSSMSLDSVANAEAAETTLETRTISLNAMIATAGSNLRLLQANIDISNSYLEALKNTESSIRNVDVATEVARFTADQLAFTGAESILGQSYGIHTTAITKLVG